MADEPQTVISTAFVNAPSIAGRSARKLGVLGLPGGGTIAANTVKEYFGDLSAVSTDFGASSDMYAAAQAIFAAGTPSFLAVMLAAKTGSPFSETLGAGSAITSGNLTAGNIPLTTITAASRDGTNILAGVVYVNGDPTTISPAPTAAQVFVNPYTGAFKLGTATTGAGAGFIITYASHDYTAALAQLDANSYNIHCLANQPLQASSWGGHNTLVVHAAAQMKGHVAALASGVLPAAISTALGQFDLTLLRNSALMAYAVNGYTGDIGSAFAAQRAAYAVQATMKLQKVPQGTTITGSYTKTQYGNELSPATGTFHAIGVNAVYKDFGGDYRITNDRSCTTTSDPERFYSSYLSKVDVSQAIDDDIEAARKQQGGTSLPLSETGLASLRQIIKKVLDKKRSEGILDVPVLADGTVRESIQIPAFGTIGATDRANRNVPSVIITTPLVGQIHVMTLVKTFTI